jgi:hypothetical protein
VSQQGWPQLPITLHISLAAFIDYRLLTVDSLASLLGDLHVHMHITDMADC